MSRRCCDKGKFAGAELEGLSKELLIVDINSHMSETWADYRKAIRTGRHPIVTNGDTGCNRSANRLPLGACRRKEAVLEATFRCAW
ncbi:unnamed protein product [Chondrus crispus]|uniref:Uncharacterized protein n=1 Tax=Chondrus crispus TaxID=2769 RepID=R7QBW8_CHOCR|nr:unnamed protein product [Chondrus crispus]CDF35293.1 unnamed protein product [Chondrus crispus]|eukprot:XP_005715112.1 unnamed protein product [Chondrus crispus]